MPRPFCNLIFGIVTYIAIGFSTEAAEGNWHRAYALLISGTPDDLQAAKPFLEASHEEGDARATFAIGMLMAIGDGYPSDVSGAMPYIRDAADRGLVGAQALAALAYKGGGSFNVDRDKGAAKVKDTALARTYTDLAMSNGSISAISSRAWDYFPYHVSYDVTRDRAGITIDNLRKSLQLHHTAWLLGNSWSGRQLETLYEGRFGAQIKATKAELDIIHAELRNAVQQLEHLAEDGDIAAQVRLGLILRERWYRGQDWERGTALLLEAARAGDSRAQLAVCNIEEPTDCVSSAAQGNTGAMELLASQVYGNRKHDLFDYSKALHITWNRAFLGDAGAEQILAFVYGQIAHDERKPLANENGADLVAGLILLFGFLAANAADSNSLSHQGWDSYQADQERLQRQIDEMSAIGWVSIK